MSVILGQTLFKINNLLKDSGVYKENIKHQIQFLSSGHIHIWTEIAGIRLKRLKKNPMLNLIGN